MKHAYVFQAGIQFSGMGLEHYQNVLSPKNYFEQANDILVFRIFDTMFRVVKMI